MKRIALVLGSLVSLAGAAFADIAVGPNPADFIPVTSADPATAAVIIGVPVAILVVIAIVLLWFIRRQSASAASTAAKAAGGGAPKKK